MHKFERLKAKICSVEQLKFQLAIWRFQDKKIVFTNGCFDLIHQGHIDYLSKAADYGDVLIVGLNTDKSVAKLKGPNRPVNDQNSRAMVLASFSFVSAVVLFEEETPLKLIDFVKPDVLVKGSDYKKSEIVGYDIVTKSGGSVITLEYLPGYSSTAMLNKIKNM